MQPSIEKTNVKEFYDKSYKHWSSTRHKPWPGVMTFIESFSRDDHLIDIGCGNGKYIIPSSTIVGQVTAVDACIPLLSLIKKNEKNSHDLIASDILQIPFRDNVFDTAICIAVLHHLSTEERRIKAIKEVSRVVKENGKILFYVWAFEQGEKSRRKFTTKDSLVPWHYREPKKSYDKYTKSDIILYRYCHLYEKGELDIIILKCDLIIISTFYEKGNWGVICKNKSSIII